MRFFSTRELLEIDGFPLTIPDEKPSRREYLTYLTRFALDRKIPIETFVTVESVSKRDDGAFDVAARRPGRETQIIGARRVVLAVGGWDNPRRLGVPGEDLDKVTYRFTEPHPYVGRKVLVVGGRNSAVETALILHRAGAEVSLSYRRKRFDGLGLKYWLRPDIENRIRSGEIHGYLGTTVERITWESVTLRDEEGKSLEVANDFVIAHTGYDPPVGFLESTGINVEEETNIPEHDPETLETNVPGLYVAGTIIAGNVSGHIFIENMREHGEQILNSLNAPSAV